MRYATVGIAVWPLKPVKTKSQLTRSLVPKGSVKRHFAGFLIYVNNHKGVFESIVSSYDQTISAGFERYPMRPFSLFKLQFMGFFWFFWIRNI